MSTVGTDDGCAPAEWLRGWTVVLSSGLGIAISVTHVFTIGLFLDPLHSAFGWTRSAVTAGPMISSTIGVLFSPAIGLAIDRWGPRPIALAGTTVFCVGTMTLAAVNASIWTWWGAWVLVSLGLLCLKPTVWTAALATLFDRGRGLAMGVALSGSGLGSALLPALTNHLIQTLGWREAYLIIGLVEALVVLPVLFFLFRDYGSSSARNAVRVATAPGTIRRILSSRKFWQLAIAGPIVGFSTSALVVHYTPILIAHGISRATAAALAALIGVGSVIGRIGSGFLLDRLNPSLVAGVSFALPLIAVALLLAFDGSSVEAVAVASILGLSFGAELDIVAYLTSRHFGIKRFGFVFGTIMGVLAWAIGGGPLAASVIFDKFGNYTVFLWFLIPVSLVSILLISTLGAPDADIG
jgi:predicted MFS family arabinose efflux permease